MAWDLKSDRPIYAQLIEQIQLRVVTGQYQAGSKMPSVRDLAFDASVNPNTMQRALTQLETEGLIYSQRTSGRYVTEDEGKIMQTKNNLAEKLVQDFTESMNSLGYDKPQTIAFINRIEEEQ